MTISVALCTYNGASYIQEQIESILRQTMPVNEVVVCDDGSKDNTLQKIEELRSYAEERGISLVVQKNAKSLGVLKNFEKAIHKCSCDVVFLSDQDDVWDKDKVTQYIGFFEQHPKIQAIFGNARLIDEKGTKLTEMTVFDCLGVGEREEDAIYGDYSLEVFLQQNRAVGATMAIRKSFFYEEFADGFPIVANGVILHDELLAMRAIQREGLGVIPNPTMSYRIHSSQERGLGALIKQPFRSRSFFEATYCPLQMEESVLTNEKYHQRACFSHERMQCRYEWFGLWTLRYAGKYKSVYGEDWCRFALYDIRMSWHHSFERIIRFVK